MNLKFSVSVIATLVLVVNQFFAYSTFASEYVISGNGDGSQNNIAYQNESSNNIVQSNEAEINNEVDAEANTGGNEASGNTGEVDIETGDAYQNVEIENSGNTSSAEISCCEDEESSIVIANNGSDANNAISYDQSTNTAVSQTNKLTLTNKVTINTNTGENEAGENEGDVEIETGDVNINGSILNKNLNSSYIKASKSSPNFNLKISGNGSGSTNVINDSYASDEIFTVLNELSLTNEFISYANTGKNKANKNLAKVFISTGNVYLDLILNNQVNTSKVIAECCKKSPTPTPTPTSTPSDSPSPSSTPSSGGGGGGNGGNGGGGSSASSGGSGGNSESGQVLGATLPETGGNAFLLMTIAALLILTAGVILRTDYAYAQKTWQYFNYNFSAPFVIYLLTVYKTLSFSTGSSFARGRPLYLYPKN